MEESILTSIKILLGIDGSYTHFDSELIMDINTALSRLTTIGVGPSTGFEITGEDETWEDFIGTDPRLAMVKNYIQLQVKLLFDTSTTASAVLEIYKQKIAEFEWLLNVTVENDSETEEE